MLTADEVFERIQQQEEERKKKEKKKKKTRVQSQDVEDKDHDAEGKFIIILFTELTIPQLLNHSLFPR